MLSAFKDFSMFINFWVLEFHRAKSAGGFGAGSDALSFSNIKITDNISGLSSG
jgi:hypothetical protein